jgi:hypothetical protein
VYLRPIVCSAIKPTIQSDKYLIFRGLLKNRKFTPLVNHDVCSAALENDLTLTLNQGRATITEKI